MKRPACPTCGTTDERPPDALGVHRCPACAIEFRPPNRMPIRRAAVTTVIRPNNDTYGWVVGLAIIGALAGVAVAVGDQQAASRSPRGMPPPITFEPISPPVLDPALLQGLEALEKMELPLTTVPLEHEVHQSQVVEGRLFATGLITAPSSSPIDEIIVEVSGRDRAGAPLPRHRAVVSCEAMVPGDTCAWMIDVEAESPIAEVEVTAVGRLSLGLGPPSFDLRSSRPNELKFDAKQGIVKFTTGERSILGAWATVTAYGPQQRVLGVAKTHWPDRLATGRHRLQVAVPESTDEIERYEIHVGGLLPDW